MPLPGGWPPDVPCARCGTHVAGLAWGEACRECQVRRRRRANALAARAALPAALAAALYAGLRLPPLPLARFYGALAVVVTYLVVRKVVQRVALELLPD